MNSPEIDFKDAERWRKLVRLIGDPRNSSEVTVKFFIDDATNEHFILCDKVESYHGRSFEQVMDSIPDVCKFCYLRNCYCCPECGLFVAQHESGCSLDPNKDQN